MVTTLKFDIILKLEFMLIKGLKRKKKFYHIVIAGATATVTAALAFLFSFQSHGQVYY